jgi:hypothetical protein
VHAYGLRVRFGVWVFVVVAVVPATAAGAASTYTAKATTACLTARHVLAQPERRSRVLPPGLPATDVVQFSLALIPAQALDNGYIVFERDAPTAQRVAERWFRYDLAQAAKVKGVDLTKIKIRLRDVFTVKGNTITGWRNQPVKPASRRLIGVCLR